jgi:hypothetical protein
MDCADTSGPLWVNPCCSRRGPSVRFRPLGRTHIQRPHQPIRVPSFRLALHDEDIFADGELIVRARIGDLARANLEGRGLGIDAGPPKPTIVSGRLAMTRTETGSPPAGAYTASIPKAANVASTAPWNTGIRCACP